MLYQPMSTFVCEYPFATNALSLGEKKIPVFRIRNYGVAKCVTCVATFLYQSIFTHNHQGDIDKETSKLQFTG